MQYKTQSSRRSLLISLALTALAAVLPIGTANAQRTISAEEAKQVIGGAKTDVFGLSTSPQAHYDRNYSLQLRAKARGDRPDKLILTEYLPPIGNQRNTNSCVSWSTGYYTYTYIIARDADLSKQDLKNPKNRMSPAFVYHNRENLTNPGGMPISRGFEILVERGCASEIQMPFSESDISSLPPEGALNQAKKLRARSIASLYRGFPMDGKYPDLEALKQFLATEQVPVVLGIPIFTDFPSKVDSNFVYNVTVDPRGKDANGNSNLRGLHAITIIGYDDSKKAFRMVNSWGPEWGDQGYLWLSEDFMKNWSLDCWTAVGGGPKAKAAGNASNLMAKFEVIAPKKKGPAARPIGADSK